MDLRSRKLSRLGMALLFAWLCFVTAIIVTFVGLIIDGTFSREDPATAVLYIVLCLVGAMFVPTVDMLFEYSGFAFSYEGRHLPSMLFTGIRTVFVIAAPVAALTDVGIGAVNSGLDVGRAAQTVVRSGGNTYVQNSMLVLIGTILLLVGVVLNGLLFCAYAFTSARYNGKAFMIMGIIFSGIEVIGLALTIISLLALGGLSAITTDFTKSMLSHTPWYAYVAAILLFIGKVMQFFSFITGYAPAAAGPAPAPAPMGGPSGYNY